MVEYIVVAVILVTLSSIWVYLDASEKNIGKIENDSSLFNMSAGAWGVATLLLWVIGFPVYLIRRASLIKKAKKSPVRPKGQAAKTIALIAAGGIGVFLALNAMIFVILPSCNADITTNLVGQIVNNIPEVKTQSVTYVSLDNIVELGYNDDSQIRSCNATLVTTAGENNIQYNVKWLNQEAGEIKAEIRIQ